MTTSTPAQRSTSRHGSRWFVLLVLLAGMGIGAAGAAAVLERDDDPSSGNSAAQFSEVQASCRDWLRTSSGGIGPDKEWCTNMFAWMADQSGGAMMGSMMSRGPEEIGRWCRAWVKQSGANDGASGEQQCDAMVDWMKDHMSGRGGNWMMDNR